MATLEELAQHAREKSGNTVFTPTNFECVPPEAPYFYRISNKWGWVVCITFGEHEEWAKKKGMYSSGKNT